jgi:pyruvate dehydrogenase E2 component (dihydrolipoamide acetyltransferase)
MAIGVIMPALGMAQETGRLVAWRKREGESVVAGEPLLDIETDKVILELESPGDGILAGVKVEDGTEVPVGQIVAWIVSPGETPPVSEEPPNNAPTSESGQHAISTASVPLTAAARPAEPVDLRISPKARRLARERGVDLGILRGSGAGGEILASDVLAAPCVVAGPPSAVETLSAIARLMAERTTLSWTTVPHFFAVREIAADALVKLRELLAPTVSHTDILIALVARTLLRHPRLNASWSAEGIRRNAAVNLAIAIAVKDGVIAPVIRDAHCMPLNDISARRRDLTDRARAGRLRPADLTDGTFAISNLGMYGVDALSAIVTPPQAAILAVGAIADRVVAVDGSPAVRPTITLTLSSDHRVVDGAAAAMFLRDLAEAIRQPAPSLGAGS